MEELLLLRNDLNDKLLNALTLRNELLNKGGYADHVKKVEIDHLNTTITDLEYKLDLIRSMVFKSYKA